MIRAINERGWHPVGLGMSVYLFVLIVFNVLDAGTIHNDILADCLVAVASVSLVAICVGWWAQNGRMLGIGFLIAGFAVVTRSVFLIVGHEWYSIGAWTGLGVAIIAIGSYIKEGHARQRERINDAGT